MDVGVSATVADEEGLSRLYDRIEGPGGLVQRIADAEHKVDKHEAICAERYKEIDNQLWWMRWLMIALLTATVLEPRTVVTAVLKQWGVEVTAVPALKPPGG